jgi:hypothetical protein
MGGYGAVDEAEGDVELSVRIMSATRRISWVGFTLYLLLALAGSLAIWFWPQSPRWRRVIPNPEANPSKLQLLFFSDDSQRVFFTEIDKKSENASVLHYAAQTGDYLQQVELWRNRHENTGVFAPIILGQIFRDDRRTFGNSILQSNNGRNIEFFDVHDGKLKGAEIRDINSGSHSISKLRRWVYYFSSSQRPEKTPDVGEKPDLIIADFKTGEIILQLKPDADSSSKTPLSYGWEAVFNPTECFIALAWNSLASFSSEDIPENHQSQIRIYDLLARKEIRRITLPSGSSWSVRSWEENQLWLQRLWMEPLDKIKKNNYVTYSRPARLALEPIHPQPVEYPQFLDTQTPKNQSMEFISHRRYPQGVILNHQWYGKNGTSLLWCKKSSNGFPQPKAKSTNSILKKEWT